MSINSIFRGEFEDQVEQSIRPLWTVDLEDDEAVLKWMNSTHLTETKKHERYRALCLKHHDLFRGQHYSDRVSNRAGYAESSAQGLAYRAPKVSKLVLNYLFSATQQRVNLMTRNRPDVTINPVNSEYSDRISARFTKHWTDYQLWRLEFDRKVALWLLSVYIFGEAYMHPYWDPESGLPMKGTAPVEGESGKTQMPRLPVTDSKGKPVQGVDGKPLFIQKPVRVGDMGLVMLTPLEILVQASAPTFQDAEYFFREVWMDIDELLARYPDQAEKLQPENSTDSVLNSNLPAPPDPNKVMVRFFWHRSTEMLGAGRYVMSTRQAVLENRELPKGMTKLPLVRITDIDVPNEQKGQSLFTQGKGINAMLNDLASMIRRNTLMAAHPKWLIPKGSLVKKDATGNDITQIEYVGPIEPRLVAPPPMSQETSQLRKEFREEFFQMFRISPNQQGIIPPNIRSALAMQMTDEADEQRASTDIAKVHAGIRETVESMLEIASCYYEKGDPRLVPIVGRDQRYLLQEFDPEHLQCGYDVRVTNSSGLPKTKAARTETIIELKKAFPTMPALRDEVIADVLEFADTDRVYDAMTVAIRAAEAENEAILAGEEVQDPVKFENLTAHWTVHMREMQQRGFKASTPVEVQSSMIQHQMTTEMLMLEMCRNNPLYALDLVELPQFPAFYKLGDVDKLILDRARLGEPMSLQEIQFVEQNGALPPVPAAPTVSPDLKAKRAAAKQQPGAPQTAPPVDGVPATTQPIQGE